MKIMVRKRRKTESFYADSEKEATLKVEEYKENALTEGYTVLKTKIDYKSKKDRKTGEIVEEYWIVEITISYEI